MSASYPDKSIEALRALILVIDRELKATTTSPALTQAWTEMVQVLALGRSPELRTCPKCGEVGMRAASRCSRCWTSLELLAPTTPVS